MGCLTEWNDELSVGNKLLDEQHKKMLKISSEAGRVFAIPSVTAEQYHLLLNDFAEKQREHFDTEEETLSRNGYPDLERHIAEHDVYRLALNDLLCNADAGEFYMRSLLSLMASYFGHHLLHVDMACKDYLKDR